MFSRHAFDLIFVCLFSIFILQLSQVRILAGCLQSERGSLPSLLVNRHFSVLMSHPLVTSVIPSVLFFNCRSLLSKSNPRSSLLFSFSVYVKRTTKLENSAQQMYCKLVKQASHLGVW